MQRSPYRQPIPLFDERALTGSDDFRARLRDFAHAVARRHRRTSFGVNEFRTALRGYYRTLAICAEPNLPPLDDEHVAYATQEYATKRGLARPTAA
jgi:hypothetical protein